MRLPRFLHREPDFIVGGPERPYLLRWYITPWSGWFRDIPESQFTAWHKFWRSLPNIYLHKFLRDDDDRALHDHPWPSLSIILKGGYIEHLPEDRKRYCRRWAVIPRSATHRHRIELYKGCWIFPEKGLPVQQEVMPAWTIFITWRKIREWGFWCPSTTGFRFVHWEKFTAPEDSGQVGKGCGE